MNRQDNTIDYIEFPGTSAVGVAAAKAFYGRVFGWSFKDWGADYIDTRSSGTNCGFSADPAHCPRAPLAVIYVADLESALTAVQAAGGQISRGIFAFPGGHRFHFIDPAGNELAVWSDQ